MGQAEIVVVGLLVAVVGLSALARRLSLPYPIVLVLGGALLGFVPGLPEVRLDPEVVLLLFLPPLLYGSSIFANFNDFRGDLHWLALNTVGLVLVTMGVVAWVAHVLIPGLPWAAAFILGAIVSPTDPLAPATIMRRLGVPRRLVSAVEGEGLFNDATALVAYRVAVDRTRRAAQLHLPRARRPTTLGRRAQQLPSDRPGVSPAAPGVGAPWS